MVRLNDASFDMRSLCIVLQIDYVVMRPLYVVLRHGYVVMRRVYVVLRHECCDASPLYCDAKRLRCIANRALQRKNFAMCSLSSYKKAFRKREFSMFPSNE